MILSNFCVASLADVNASDSGGHTLLSYALEQLEYSMKTVNIDSSTY